MIRGPLVFSLKGSMVGRHRVTPIDHLAVIHRKVAESIGPPRQLIPSPEHQPHDRHGNHHAADGNTGPKEFHGRLLRVQARFRRIRGNRKPGVAGGHRIIFEESP
jgi:hypothetical protein